MALTQEQKTAAKALKMTEAQYTTFLASREALKARLSKASEFTPEEKVWDDDNREQLHSVPSGEWSIKELKNAYGTKLAVFEIDGTPYEFPFRKAKDADESKELVIAEYEALRAYTWQRANGSTGSIAKGERKIKCTCE